MGPPGIPAPRTSWRPGWGKGSCQKMRRWPRAADAAVAFIFKLPSGQRARRGRGPRRAGRLHPRPFRGPPIPFSHLASGIPGAAPVPGSEREPLSMAATSLGVRGCLGGSQRRRRRRPAARIGVPRRITPGPARRATTRRLGELWRRSRLARLVACGLAVAGRPVSVGSGLDPSACPAPAQSRPLPNPIVRPGLGLASRLARTKCDAGRATPAAPGDRAPAPPAAPPPWGPGPGAWDASPAVAAEGTLQLSEDARRAASPCGRALVRAAARGDYVGSARVTHAPLGLGGAVG